MFNKLPRDERENLKKLLEIKLLKSIKSNNNKSKNVHVSYQNKIEGPDHKIDIKLKTKNLSSLDCKEPKNINQNITLKYVPKRLAKLKENNSSNSILSQSVLLSPIARTARIGVERYKQKTTKNIILTRFDFSQLSDKHGILNFNNVKFRNEHMIKYGIIKENFENLKNRKDIISQNNRNAYMYYYEHILKNIQNQTDIIFNSLFFLGSEEEKNIKNEINYIIQRLVLNTEEHNINVNKLIYLLIEELNASYSDNVKISKQRMDLELQNNINEKNLDKLNKIIEIPEITERIFAIKKFENKVKSIKMEFMNKENDYILLINKLKEDINNLSYMLGKNKIFYEKYKENEETIKQNKKEKLEMKKQFKKELSRFSIKESIGREYKEQLNEKIKELENVKELMREKKLEFNQKEVKYKVKIEGLENIINQQNENALMLNEELNSYYYLVYIKSKNDNMKILN